MGQGSFVRSASAKRVVEVSKEYQLFTGYTRATLKRFFSTFFGCFFIDALTRYACVTIITRLTHYNEMWCLCLYINNLMGEHACQTP